MPRKRLKNKNLPLRVYWKNGAYRYLTREGKWIKLGVTLSEALKKYAEMFETGILENNTMNSLFDRYTKEILPQKAESTNKNQIYNIGKLKIYFGMMIPDTILPRDIYRYIDLRAKKSIFSANKDLSILSDVFTWGIRWGVVDVNPCKDVKRFPEPASTDEISDKDFKAFYDFVPDYMKAILWLEDLTGLRRGDVLAIQEQAIVDDGIMTLANKTKKYKKSYIITWTAELREAISFARKVRLNRNSMFLFCKDNGQPFAAEGFKTLWRRLMQAAVDNNIISAKFKFKTLRSRVGTKVSESKGLQSASDLLDHSDSKVTKKHYDKSIKKVPAAR
jgi:integrase